MSINYNRSGLLVYLNRSLRLKFGHPPTMNSLDTGHMLILSKGEPKIRNIRLSNRTFIIGRSSRADIIIHSDYVSGRHAELAPEKNGFCIIDLGSTNGTTVNGKSLSTDPIFLNDGDLIQFANGAVCLSYRTNAGNIRTISQDSKPVESASPDIGVGSQFPKGTVTFMFTDMADSTPLVQRLGDLRARKVVHHHDQLIKNEINRYDGHVVKEQGDGFMVAFASARSAVMCASSIQRALASFRHQNPKFPVNVRIGLNTGEAVSDNNDYFGQSVILAARISSSAEAGEILTSTLTRQLTAAAGDISFDGGHELTLKGLTGTHRVYRVKWT